MNKQSFVEKICHVEYYLKRTYGKEASYFLRMKKKNDRRVYSKSSPMIYAGKPTYIGIENVGEIGSSLGFDRESAELSHAHTGIFVR